MYIYTKKERSNITIGTKALDLTTPPHNPQIPTTEETEAQPCAH